MSGDGPRVLAIGIGEAAWDRLHRFAAHIPYLSGLEASGARGVTLAPQPLDVAASWANVVTGTTPGSHGIFSTLRPDPVKGNRYVGPDDLAARPIWRLLGDDGIPVGTFNVMYTDRAHPPGDTGFVIAHDPRPRIHPGLVYPPDLYRDLTRRYGTWETGAKDKSDEEWLQEVPAEAAVRTDILVDLLSSRPWRFVLVHVHEIAKAQHRFWDDGTDRLQSTYSLVDQSLARLAAAVGPDTYVFLFSECGAGPIRHGVHLDSWLAAEGYLRRRTGAVQQAGLTAARIQKQIRRFLPKSQALSRVKARLFGRIAASNIDWENTRAHSPGSTDEIMLTVPAAERPALAAEITERLLALRDPEGRRVVEAVIPRQAWNLSFEHTPDLVVVWDDDAYVPVESFSGADTPVFEDWIQPGVGRYVGSHRRHGILLVSGPGIGHVDVGTVSTIDLAPTWLDLLGRPKPADLEGTSFAARLAGA